MTMRNRVKTLKRMKAGDLRPHPLNYRVHGDDQMNPLRALLGEVGIAEALVAYEDGDEYVLIDGHARASVDPQQVWPVLILDVTADEASKLLATMNPLGALATHDGQRLNTLLQGIETEADALVDFLHDLSIDAARALRQHEDAAAAGGDESHDAPQAEDQQRDSGTPPQVVSFSFPLTTAQESLMRRIVRQAKARFNVDTTGEAVMAALTEWAAFHDTIEELRPANIVSDRTMTDPMR